MHSLVVQLTCHSSTVIEDAHKVTRPRNITRVILTLMTSDVR